MKERATIGTQSQRKPTITKKQGKTVKFSLSPKWKGRVIPGGRPKNVLRVLQSDASNSKILVGAGSPRLPAFGKGKKVCSAKHLENKENEVEVALSEEIKQEYSDKSVQTEDSKDAIKDQALMGKNDSEDVTMEEYWRELAEQRRLALQETLFENEELCTEVAILKSKLKKLESFVNQVDYYSMMEKISDVEKADTPGCHSGAIDKLID